MAEASTTEGETGQRPLAGSRILILEDEVEVAALLEAAVRDAGGEVLTIVGTIDEALAVIRDQPLTAAVITMIAEGIHTELVAGKLQERGIPFAVTTGIGTSPDYPLLHAAPEIIKPFQANFVQDLLAALLESGPAKT